MMAILSLARRKSRVFAVTAWGVTVAVLSFAVSACTSPDTGTLQESPSSEASESPSAELAFNDEAAIGLDLCPAVDELPTEFVTAGELPYRSEPSNSADQFPGQRLECTYEIDHEESYRALHGVESPTIAWFSVVFHVTDGTSVVNYLPDEIDLTDLAASSYFQDWDDAACEVRFDRGGELIEGAELLEFNFAGSSGNLYVDVYSMIAVPQAMADHETDRIEVNDVATAGFEILNTLVPPVVDNLERN
jgi:hypothetical protein